MDFWRRGTTLNVPWLGYAPSEFQKKPWPQEALIEGWIPRFTRGREGFDLVEDATARGAEWEQQSSPPTDNFRVDGRRGVARPRHMRDLGADAYVEQHSLNAMPFG